MLELAMEDLIVHRGTMRWVDRVESATDDRLVGRTTIDSRFSTVDHVVPAMNCVELMAQTVAALVGHKEAKDGIAPRLGYLVAVRTLDLSVDSLDRGMELSISASLVFGSDQGGVFACEVRSAERVLAKGELTVYRELGANAVAGAGAS